LAGRSQASIGDVMAEHSATQGLGSVVGYVALGSRHGVRVARTETVSWLGADNLQRRARIPTIYFLQDRVHELS
jgi:hypothetical protein